MKAKLDSKDPLTGLMDRSVMDSLQEDFSRRSQPWSLLIIDVDHFKLVNDIYGHLTGDEILSHVGHTIRVNLKRNDHAIRYGGDEFLAILPDTDGNSALDLAQRLLFELGNREFPGGLKISASLGVAQSRPSDDDLKKVLAMADQALYRAKETGRGRFVLADNLSIRREVEPDFTHMVGRRKELQLLRDKLDSLSRGKSEFCLLTGYQGMGKTRLVKELANYASFKKIPLFRTEIHPVREEHGFLAVNTARMALESLSEKELSSLIKEIGPVETCTVEHLGEFGLRIKKRSLPPDSLEAWVRSRKDMGRILKTISLIKPFIIVLDNLHYASEISISYMAELLLEIPEAEIFTIAIGRKEESAASFKPLLGESCSLSIHLEPLTRSDVRTMLFFALKSPGVPVDVLDYMMNQSGGNTLFLRKLIKWCIETGSLSVGEGDICNWKEPAEEELPGDILAVVDGMLNGQTGEEMRVLKRAALAGDSLDLKLLSQLTGMGEFTLAEILDGFVEKNLISDNGDSFRFTFGVMRSYLVSKISRSLRYILHEKTAKALEADIGKPDHRNITQIAGHYCNSRNESKALHYSREAAKITFSMGLHSQSIHWYREYLNRIPANIEPVEYFSANINIGILFSITGKSEEAEKHLMKALELADTPADFCTVHYRLGDNFKRRSSYPEAIEHYQKAVSIGRSSSSRDKVLMNNMIGALLESSFISRLQSRLEEAGEKLQEARILMEDSPEGYDPKLETLYYARLADLESESGSPRNALDYYRHGLEIAIRQNDLNGEALVLNNMHSLFMLSGDYTAMLETLKKVVKLNNRLDDQLGLAIAYYNLAESYSSLNMLDLARRYFQLYIELNSRIENRLGMGYGQLGLGRLFFLEGKSDKALQYLLNASDIFEDLKCMEMMCEAQLEIARVRIGQKEYSEALALLNSIDETCSTRDFSNRLTHLTGFLLVVTGESVDRGIFMVESSIRNAEDLTPFEVVSMYCNLYMAYMSSGSEQQALHTLSNGVEVLKTTISQIKTESIRNSILSRTDIEDYLNLCRQRGVACSI